MIDQTVTSTVADDSATDEVAARMRAFYDAWTARDTDAHYQFFADRPDFLIWGSDTWEAITGKGEAYRQFPRWVASCPPWTRMEPRERLIRRSGNIVFVADDLLADFTRGAEQGRVNFRVTMIWELIAGEWQIIHGHISIPD